MIAVGGPDSKAIRPASTANLNAAAIAGGTVDGIEQLGLTALGAAVGATVSFFKTVAQERLGILETRSNMLVEESEEGP